MCRKYSFYMKHNEKKRKLIKGMLPFVNRFNELLPSDCANAILFLEFIIFYIYFLRVLSLLF